MTLSHPARLLQILLRGAVSTALAAGLATTAFAAAPPLTPVGSATVASADGVQAIVSDASGRFVYRLTWNTAAIGQFGINRDTGALTALGAEVSAVPGGNTRAAKGSALVIDPYGRFVYAAVTGGVAGFSIGNEGQLTPVADKLAGTGNNAATALTISPDSKFLYALHCWNASIGLPGTCGVAVYSINLQSGALTQVTAGLKPLNGMPVVPVLNGGGSIAATPDGKYLLLTAGPTNKGTLAVYARNAASGQLGALVTQKPTATPNPKDIVVTAKGHIYVAESEIVPPGSTFSAASAISAFRFDAGAQTLTPVAGSPWTPPVLATAIAIDNTGSRLYATGCTPAEDGCNGSVWVYDVNAETGALTQAGQPQASGTHPVGIAIDASSRYVYTANGASDRSGNTTVLNTDAPSLSGTTVDIGLLNITANATFANPGDFTPKASGFYYGTMPWPANGGSVLNASESYGRMTATLSRATLTRDVTWYVQPFFTTGAGITYLGNVASFVNGRVVQRMGAPTVNFTTLELSGGLVELHGQTAAKTGFRIGIGEDPTLGKNIDVAATLEGNVFKAQEAVTALNVPNATYNIWPYMKTTGGETVYGEPYAYFNITPPMMTVGHNFTDINHVRFASSLVLANAKVEGCGFAWATHSKPTVSDAAVPLKACGSSEFATDQPLAMYRDPASKFALGATYFVRSYTIFRGQPYYSDNEVIFHNINPIQLSVRDIGAASASFIVTYDINRVNGNLLRPPYEVSWKKVGAGATPAKVAIGNSSQESGTLQLTPGLSYTAQASLGYAGDKSGMLQTDVAGFTAPAK